MTVKMFATPCGYTEQELLQACIGLLQLPTIKRLFPNLPEPAPVEFVWDEAEVREYTQNPYTTVILVIPSPDQTTNLALRDLVIPLFFRQLDDAGFGPMQPEVHFSSS